MQTLAVPRCLESRTKAWIQCVLLFIDLVAVIRDIFYMQSALIVTIVINEVTDNLIWL